MLIGETVLIGTMATVLADALPLIAAAICGAAVFLLVKVLEPAAVIESAKQRFAQMRSRAMGNTAELPAATEAPRGLGATIVERLGDLNRPLVSKTWAAKMKRRFTTMGRPHYRPQDFLAQQELYALLFGLLGMMLSNLVGGSAKALLSLGVPFALFGFLFPYIWLKDQISRRHKAILRALPYHMDLLTLAVEAGLEFTQALATVVEKGQGGALLDELSITIGEMKLGKTREEALRNLVDRVQLSAITSFVANLIQADKMGTSLGKVLRIQTVQMRMSRAQRAEKAANEAPVKMLLPLVLCFFPTVFMILFGPILYRMVYGG